MEPIIQSRLETDFYKLTMGQVVFKKYRDLPVKFALKNRTASVPLARHISEAELRRELDHVMTLPLTNTEAHYIRGTNEYGDRMFDEKFIEFFKTFRLPPYRLEWGDEQLTLEFEGPWASVMHWEIPALSIVNELYYRSLMKGMSAFERECVYATGQLKLVEKVRLLLAHGKVTCCDFGLRRRFSRDRHDYAVRVMAEELPKQFLGTSNVYLAMKYGLLPMGTSAHELFMVLAGMFEGIYKEPFLEDALVASHRRVLDDWWGEFGQGLSIYLPDTFSTDFGLRCFTPEQGWAWKGMRHDSGDPYQWGEQKVIPYYRAIGVDPREKLAVFSDSLNVSSMIKLHDHFTGRIRPTFGWGTNLTNDFGFKTLSLVIKTVEACGQRLVKLSDNIAKAIGTPEDIARYAKAVGYSTDYNKECVS